MSGSQLFIGDNQMKNTNNGKCLFCDGYTDNPKFCSSSCAAKFNNKNRSKESREKQRITLFNTLGLEHKPKKRKTPNFILSAKKSNLEYTLVRQCNVCDKWYNLSSRKSSTCSDDCYYYTKIVLNAGKSKHVYNGINMESSWEVSVAKELDSLSISWIRPKDAIPWIDEKGKTRKYFPDFYLEEYDIYLDPKNPIAMKKQQEKVNYFSNNDKMIIGSLAEIISFIRKLNSGAAGGIRTHM